MSYSYVPNVADLINNSDAKNLGISNVVSPLYVTAYIEPCVPSRGNINMNV